MQRALMLILFDQGTTRSVANAIRASGCLVFHFAKGSDLMKLRTLIVIGTFVRLNQVLTRSRRARSGARHCGGRTVLRSIASVTTVPRWSVRR